MFQSVLMVCIGNVCRSPMAEALLRAELQGTHPEVKVSSAGLGALVGHPADPLAIELMAERGIDLSAHRARQLEPELLRDVDLVLVMETRQQKAIEALSPRSRGKVQLLGRFGGFEVPDPYRKPRAAFEEALGLIVRGVNDLKRFYR